MRPLIFLLLATAIMKIGYAHAATQQNQVRSYLCTVDQAIGISAGRSWTLNLSAQERRFTIKIEPVGKPRPGVNEDAYCAALGKKGRTENTNLPEWDYWFHCKAPLRLTFSGGKSFRELRGEKGSSVFYDILRGYFHIDGARYTYVQEPNFQGVLHVENGQCDEI